MRHVFRLLATAGVLGLSAPAMAQSGTDPTHPVEADSGTQDIIVTAAKSGQQTLQKTPLAIQAFDGRALKEKNISRVDDLIQLIPGASENSQSGIVNRSYNLRGVGGTSGTNGDSPIGYYIDDIPFSVTNFGIAPPISFTDLDRVEVLRGPQGTLYGNGAAGGIMIFHTKDPDLEKIRVNGEISSSTTDGASHLNFAANGAVSIPIIKDQLAIRVSANYSNQPGYADVYYGSSITGKPDERDANYARTRDIRAVVLWKPADNLQIRAQVWNIAPKQGYSSLLNSLDPAAFTNTNGVFGYSRGEFTLYGLSGQLDLGGVSIHSATSYIDGHFSSLFPTNPTGTYYSGFTPKTFTQELRLNSNGSAPLHWMIGGQYQDGSDPQDNILDIPAYGLYSNATGNLVTKNVAAFGEVSYDLFGGKLVPLVGLRYYHDKRTNTESGVESITKKDKVTWRVNLAFIPSRNLTAFVTASSGFRAGITQSELQIQALKGIGLTATAQNEPDTLTNYEAGIKYRTVDGALSVGVNLYRIDFKNMQTSVTGLYSVGGYINLGNAHSNGVDVDLQWRTPLKGLSFSAVGNVNDSKFDEVNAIVSEQVPAAQRGKKLIGAAAYNYRLDANYTGHLTESTDVFGNVGFSRFGSRIMVSGVVVPAYSLVSATVGLRRGIWEVALFGENLNNDRSPTYDYGSGLVSGPRPRTIGLRLRANY